ncbi:transcriptional regulator, TetR family [Bryocella elongata]|uniref:Transcriptional regulator, TetR family n=1 Tax=Bryocella elongata TaxID=863522 RepID=A0A1H5SRT6_9BACT|nr:transcriptional regulator, TetR family [Bryocella elongata]
MLDAEKSRERLRKSTTVSRRPTARKAAPPVQDRALQTRQDLLDAARRVFARDGFELARLEDIARVAGKTRGALYTHFANKEDLFFALIEEDIARDTEIYVKQLTPESTFEDRVKVISGHLEELLRDRKRMLLYVEFKMYVLRHPTNQKRLAELHAKICREGAARKLDLIPEFSCQTDAERRRTGGNFGATLDGLALNMYFDPEGLTAEDVRRRIQQLVHEQLLRQSIEEEAEALVSK